MHNRLSIRNAIITLTKNLPHLPISPSPYLPISLSPQTYSTYNPIPDSRFPIPDSRLPG
ncbi:MAG: hypothetical protein F6J94_02050 [Moorea sp. SIO1F2]|uniref:hypothetical protein n=1 Tax=Moorena TaxID=1155738 RepID=UPI0013014F5F|nr:MULTISPECIES: hypothetical protein [Moorena]NEN98826.1 hypothetical protein [Moorena sp. SIO3I7]NEO05613.1 hypothetical protein [Moorena sp. SIO3I8]NEO22358.1 hypothetical protein [Moorena sp. SIO4A5]NEP24367.1 hypothetical protein [Moorena sp. SIO3I6]NEQ58415.1 hypothetical protein [Moorena sp. SIO4A1]